MSFRTSVPTRMTLREGCMAVITRRTHATNVKQNRRTRPAFLQNFRIDKMGGHTGRYEVEAANARIWVLRAKGGLTIDSNDVGGRGYVLCPGAYCECYSNEQSKQTYLFCISLIFSFSTFSETGIASRRKENSGAESSISGC